MEPWLPVSVSEIVEVDIPGSTAKVRVQLLSRVGWYGRIQPLNGGLDQEDLFDCRWKPDERLNIKGRKQEVSVGFPDQG